MGEIYSKREVGKRLKEMRKRLNLTQERFAEMLDISTQLYKKMENGENNVSISTLKKMKEKLNFSTDYLLFGETEALAEVWNRTLALHDMEKELLMLKLYYEIAFNRNQIESKETAERYTQLFEKIKESLADQKEDGKEHPGRGKRW